MKKIALGILTLLGSALATAAEPPADTTGDSLSADTCYSCHEDQHRAIARSPHWAASDNRSAVNMRECATCHGELEEHVLEAGEAVSQGMNTFTRASTLTPPQQNAVCLDCHRDTSRIHWEGSGHDANDVGCVGCHRVHEQDRMLARDTQAEGCVVCHTDVRAQMHKPYAHPFEDQKVTCSDCHNAHGGPGDADLKTMAVNDTCYDCHADKRGPFLWEHPPASEDCSLCHSAHGSINRDMLVRREPHLCQSCHEPTQAPGTSAGPHARHSRMALSFREPGTADVGPEVPGKGISRFVLGSSCSNCHSHVHGSSHPAGAKFMR